MERQSNYMRQRLLNNNERNIKTAKIALIGLGTIILILGFLNSFSLGIATRPMVNLVMGASFIIIGVIAKKNNKLTYQLGFLLCLVITLLNILSLSILGAVLFGVVAQRLYKGIEAAQYFSDRKSALPQMDNVLDADFFEE